MDYLWLFFSRLLIRRSVWIYVFRHWFRDKPQVFHLLRSKVSIIFLFVYPFDVIFLRRWNKQETTTIKSYFINIYFYRITYITAPRFSVHEYFLPWSVSRASSNLRPLDLGPTCLPLCTVRKQSVFKLSHIFYFFDFHPLEEDVYSFSRLCWKCAHWSDCELLDE